MAVNSAADALVRYLTSKPDFVKAADPVGQSIDQLGRALLPAGQTGLTYAEAMQAASLSRSDFLSALSSATSAELVELFDDPAGSKRIRLTDTGRSLY